MLNFFRSKGNSNNSNNENNTAAFPSNSLSLSLRCLKDTSSSIFLEGYDINAYKNIAAPNPVITTHGLLVYWFRDKERYHWTIKIWDLANGGRLVKSLKHPDGFVSGGPCIALPKGLIAVALHGPKVEIWDVENEVRIKTLEGDMLQGKIVAMSILDDQWLLLGHEVIDPRGPPSKLMPWEKNVNQQPTSPQLFKNAITVWDLNTGAFVKSLNGHMKKGRTNSIDALISFPEGRAASFGSDHCLRVWDVYQGKELKSFQMSDTESGRLSLAALQNGCLVSISDLKSGGKAIKVFNSNTGECIKTLTEEGSPNTYISVLLDGRFVTVKNIWDVNDNGNESINKFDRNEFIQGYVPLKNGKIGTCAYLENDKIKFDVEFEVSKKAAALGNLLNHPMLLLAMNQLKIEQVPQLFPANLEGLDVSNTFITDALLEAILKQCPKLRVIKYEGCGWLTEKGLALLAKYQDQTTKPTTVPTTQMPPSLAKNNPVGSSSSSSPAVVPASSASQTITKPTTKPIAPQNSLLTNPAIQQHHTFLTTLSPANLLVLESLGKQGENLNKVLAALSQLVANQQDLTQRLETVETQAGLDAQTLAEIAYIKSNPILYGYYLALKKTLAPSFYAAKVIASGDVDASANMTTTAANGISAVAGALCPPAAPFLSFAATVVGVVGGIASTREMKSLSGWVDPEVMVFMTIRLACELTLTQEQILQQGLNAKAKKNLKFIQDHCTLLVERIKSGETLTLEEGRALLDANELLSYMKENNKPINASPTDCVAILLKVIMGDNYVYVPKHGTRPAPQSSMTTPSMVQTQAPNNTANAGQYVISQEQWEAMQKMAETAAKDAAAARLDAAKANEKLETLRKQTAASNDNSSHRDNGDSTTSLYLQQNIVINTPSGAMPLNTFVASVSQQLARQDEFIGTAAPVLDRLNQHYEQASGTKNTNNAAATNDKNRLELFGDKTKNKK